MTGCCFHVCNICRSDKQIVNIMFGALGYYDLFDCELYLGGIVNIMFRALGYYDQFDCELYLEVMSCLHSSSE